MVTSKFHWWMVLASEPCLQIFAVLLQSIRPYLPIWHIPMGGQFFKIRISQFWLQIRVPLKKVAWEHGQNCKKPINLRVSLTYPLFPWFSLILDVLQLEFWKSENSLCSYFFERNPNLQSDLRNSDFEKWTSHRDMLYWKVRTDWLKQHSENRTTWL